LEHHKIQLQQVEAALIPEPNNEELLKLRNDLIEIINLQEDLLTTELAESSSKDAFSAPVPSSALTVEKKISWKVGDRCLAPSKNGQRYVAVIDGISMDKVAITFASNGVKHMVRLNELRVAPVEEKKHYLFQQGTKNSSNMPKKEWQMERERRKLRAQKKEQRRKQLDEAKEQQKNKWLNFNNKAAVKSLKGIKHIEASSSAADGPRTATGPVKQHQASAKVSSRTDNRFGATSRGNMDSLF